MVVRIWRVADGKQIGYSHPNQCTARPIAGVWHDNWSDFTEEEKHTTLELVRSFVQQQIEMTLSGPEASAATVGRSRRFASGLPDYRRSLLRRSGCPVPRYFRTPPECLEVADQRPRRRTPIGTLNSPSLYLCVFGHLQVRPNRLRDIEINDFPRLGLGDLLKKYAATLRSALK